MYHDHWVSYEKIIQLIGVKNTKAYLYTKKILTLKTQGQYWPSGIYAACICVCVRPPVRVCVEGEGGGGGDEGWGGRGVAVNFYIDFTSKSNLIQIGALSLAPR